MRRSSGVDVQGIMSLEDAARCPWSNPSSPPRLAGDPRGSIHSCSEYKAVAHANDPIKGQRWRRSRGAEGSAKAKRPTSGFNLILRCDSCISFMTTEPGNSSTVTTPHSYARLRASRLIARLHSVLESVQQKAPVMIAARAFRDHRRHLPSRCDVLLSGQMRMAMSYIQLTCLPLLIYPLANLCSVSHL